jgi:hypothetical protein
LWFNQLLKDSAVLDEGDFPEVWRPGTQLLPDFLLYWRVFRAFLDAVDRVISLSRAGVALIAVRLSDPEEVAAKFPVSR